MSQRVEGGSLTCSCGQKYHVSLFHEVLRVIANEAYELARLDQQRVVDLAIERGYESGREVGVLQAHTLPQRDQETL